MKKVFPCIFLCLCLMLAGCGSGATEQAATPEPSAVGETAVQGTPWEEIRGIDAYAPVCENTAFSLQINGATCEIALLDKATQKTWYSNPQDRALDAAAKADGAAMLAAQVIVYYKNAKGESFQYYSGVDSVELDQYDFEKLENGVRVHYTLGQKVKTYLYPPRISKERMESFLEKMSDEDKDAITFLYYLVDLDTMTEQDRNAYIAQSPALEQTPQFYNIDGLFYGSTGITKIPEYASLEAEEIFARVGYTPEDMEQDYAETGLEFPEDKKAVFELSVEYTIGEDGLCVRVPHDSIVYDKTKFRITEMDLLPYFGAASSKQSGYMLVPDGSGALIELNNGKIQYTAYKKLLYGKDRAINYNEMQTDDGENAILPVFGIKTQDGCFVGIVEEGDTSCSITADVSGRYHSYNHASAVFLLTPNALVNKKSTLSALDFQEEIVLSDFAVRYLFMKEDQLHYSGMANALREYFVKTDALATDQAVQKNGLALELLAAVKGQKTVLGYEYYTTYPLTTYAQATEIAYWFLQEGVDSLALLYEGWGSETLDNGLADQAKPNRALGGKSAFLKLAEFSNQHAVSLIPDVNFMYVSPKSLSGFSESRYSSRNIQGAVATATLYEYGTMRERTVGTGNYMVKPSCFVGLSDTFMKSIASLDFDQLYVRAVGQELNSDFHRGKLTDRTQAMSAAENLLDNVSGKYGVTVNGGNFYAVRFAERIVDFPIESGKAYLLDSEIPFVSMVLNGNVALYAKASNEYDPREMTLKLIEAGVFPQFSMIYSDISQLREAEAEILCESFETVRDKAVQVYKEVAAALEKAEGEAIVLHREIQKNVTATTYENGYTVVVNYNTTPVTVNGKTIESRSWSAFDSGEEDF